MAFYTGGIKASTEKKVAPHLGFAGYACQTIPKPILVLELTVWHNCIIRVSICNLLLAGSIQLCETVHARAWDSVCQQQHLGKECPTLQWVEPHRLPQGLSCWSPHNLPNGRDWCSHYPISCATENSIGHFDLNGLHGTWSLFHDHSKRLCRETACTALLKSMAPPFMSQLRYKTHFYNLLSLLFLEGNRLYNPIQNNLFKVYHVFFHILATKTTFPIKNPKLHITISCMLYCKA